VDKEFVSSNQLVRDAFTLARQVYDAGYAPEWLLALWRGGAPVGIAVQEFLAYKGLRFEHAVVKVSSYSGIGQPGEPCVAHGDSLLSAIAPGQRVLVVDDIADTGGTLRRMREWLAPRTRLVKSAVLYYKPDRLGAAQPPDFYVRRTDAWIVFPHELEGLSLEEIRLKDPFIHGLLAP
jgi:hypoxanthine phosphoribosyltransferase